MHHHVIAPGWQGSDEGHWQSIWQQAWGADAMRVRIASWDNPDLADYLRALDDAVGSALRPCTIVAHSLGTWAAAEWARTRRPEGVRLFLVAPPHPSAPGFPREQAPSFVLQPLPVGVPALVVASTDDPYASERQARELADGWGAPLEFVGAHGHLNSDSNLGDWPIGRALLARLSGPA